VKKPTEKKKRALILCHLECIWSGIFGLDFLGQFGPSKKNISKANEKMRSVLDRWCGGEERRLTKRVISCQN
jgi:hypothetical protein